MCIGGGTPKVPEPEPLPEPAKAPNRQGVSSDDEARRRAILAAGLTNATGPRGLLAPAQTTGKTALGG